MKTVKKKMPITVSEDQSRIIRCFVLSNQQTRRDLVYFSFKTKETEWQLFFTLANLKLVTNWYFVTWKMSDHQNSCWWIWLITAALLYISSKGSSAAWFLLLPLPVLCVSSSVRTVLLLNVESQQWWQSVFRQFGLDKHSEGLLKSVKKYI